MKRYFIDGSCECGRIDDASAFEDESGEWIKYEDYAAEKANGIKPLLDEVRALINGMRDTKKLCDRTSEDIIKDAVLDKVIQKISEHFS